MSLDLFGEPIKEPALPGPMSIGTLGGKPRRKTQPNGYAGRPGSGPASETCRTCAHLCRVQHAKTYLKCGKLRHVWTGGPGSDVRAASPACNFWEKPTPKQTRLHIKSNTYAPH